MYLEGPILPQAALLEQADFATDHAPGMIGPNAVLKTIEVMRERLDATSCNVVLRDAQIDTPPSGDSMIPEIEALRLHRWLAMHEPVAGLEIAREAGLRTADYIIAHRIPAPARALLRWLPASLAAPLLMKAISAHAWTFIGSGEFKPHGAWAFSIDRSLADDTVVPYDSVFVWYGAVFTRLFRQLVSPESTCVEVDDDSVGIAARSYRITR